MPDIIDAALRRMIDQKRYDCGAACCEWAADGDAEEALVAYRALRARAEAAEAERDEARRELGFKKKALRNCREAHLAAEARVTELEAANFAFAATDVALQAAEAELSEWKPKIEAARRLDTGLLAARVDAAEAEVARRGDLLRRLRQWDHMAVAADGTFWIREIDAALAAPTKEEGT